MPAALSAPEILQREFLEIRCKILEVAAALDRLSRAGGTVEGDPRLSCAFTRLWLSCKARRTTGRSKCRWFSRGPTTMTGSGSSR